MGVRRTLERGWHTGSIFGTFAAAAACGRVLGLTDVQMAEAFGIAGTQSSGLMAAGYASMVKRMHHGRAAQSGLYAAFLAAGGYTGIHRVFEEEYGGYCSTFLGSTDAGYDLSELTSELGTRFVIADIAIKPYACNGGIHTSVDAMKQILARRPLSSDDIQSVTVRTTPANAEHVGFTYEAASLTTAQMNMGFTLAVVIEHGDASVEQYTDKTIRDPRLVELARKVSVIGDPAFEHLPAAESLTVDVTVTLVGGAQERQRVVTAHGSARDPLSAEEIVTKFERLAGPSLGAKRTASVLEFVTNLEVIDDVSELGNLLGGARERSGHEE